MLSTRQIHILRHALGLAQCGREYRNRFVTGPGPGSKDYPDCEALVSLGLMRRDEGSELTGGDYLYQVTDAGIAAAWAGGAVECENTEERG